VSRVTRAVEATWTDGAGGPLAALLRVLSVPYGTAVALRSHAYDRGWLATHRVSARVVSVGNLVVGGSGKTPLALWLAGRLAEAGRRPAIVARGYGKRRRGVVVVGDGGRALVGAREGGDEAVLMARRFRGPVVTGEDRVAAARAAIDRFGVDTVVLDDGFQHRRLARDVDVVVMAGPPRSSRLLPAGPQREPARAGGRARARGAGGASPPPGTSCPVFRARLVPEAVVGAGAAEWTVEPPDTLADRRVVAVAGIARPERFLDDLVRLGAHVERAVLRRDHHPWTPAEVASVVAEAGEATVVTTEKDLVKWAVPAGATVRALRLGVEMDDAATFLRLAGGPGVVLR
jgi:tetraacyldisaccharide 4'-kinase